MKESIRWLHISDLHIGSPNSKWLDETLRDRLQELINDELGRIDFAIITGDVVHQGKYPEHDNFVKASKLINMLEEVCSHVVLALGNHDYARDDARFSLLAKWEKENIEDKKKKEENYAQKLRADFEEFIDFGKKIFKNTNPIVTKSYIYDKVEGINIIVLNTSIFCGQPELDEAGNIKKVGDHIKINDDGKLWISNKDLPDISELDKAIPTIVIGHHPMEMFDRASQKRIKEFMENVPAKYFFCGHAHKIQENQIDDSITQYTSAGLFKDDYNKPTITRYKIEKNANEHIEKKRYRFIKGNWEEVVSEGTNTDIECKIEESVDFSDVLMINGSEVSDGAFRFPYNNGKFNIYVTKSKTSDKIVPHLHKNMDEVTFVIKGGVYACIGQNVSHIGEGKAILMPKNKFHCFIPSSFPCEYITMSAELKDGITYETQWGEDIGVLNRLEKELENCETSSLFKLYEKIATYLFSSVLEVRWKATEILKRYLIQENDDSNYIESMLQKIVSEMLKKKEEEYRFLAIETACEFRCKVALNTIYQIMTSTENYMFSWSCAYYLIKSHINIDFANMLSKVSHTLSEDIDEKHEICVYVERVIIATMQLLLKRNANLLEKIYNTELKYCSFDNVIPIDDIVIHFVLWYTSFSLSNEKINYTKALKSIPVINNISREEILRGLLNISDISERYHVLEISKQEGKLLMVVKAFFESLEDIPIGSEQDISLKENIKNYLRIIVSKDCNLNCVYCHHEGRIDSLVGTKIKDNTNFNLKNLLKKAKECGFKKIKISGGEPLLYPNILKICNAFQNDFEDIGFTSNGTKILHLKSDFENIKERKLSFNITLNSCNSQKYERITGKDSLDEVKQGIKYLVDQGFKVKINSVITSFNVDEIEQIIAYAARMRIDIKLLDLFSVGRIDNEFQHISIAEIKNKLMELYQVDDTDFELINDYMCVNVMGIRVMIPQRVYSSDCQYNCQMYPCAEGLFGIRVYEDYSCARCFKGNIYSGGLEDFSANIELIRKDMDITRFSF